MDSQISTSTPRMKEDSALQHLRFSAPQFTSIRRSLIPVEEGGVDSYSTSKSDGAPSRALFNGKDPRVKKNLMGWWLYVLLIPQFLSIYNSHVVYNTCTCIITDRKNEIMNRRFATIRCKVRGMLA
jgi:hypothetical protein